MNITVYCGAHHAKDPEFNKRAAELGSWMAENGCRLVYGGGSVGTMGVIADAVLSGGGEVTGVTPEFFITAGEIDERLTETIVVPNMSVRRSKMIELGDAYIALPGGTGTIDEITEVISDKRLGQLGSVNKPVIIYNINGYYDLFVKFMDKMIEEGLYEPENRSQIDIVTNIQELAEALSHAGEPVKKSLYNN